MVTKASIVESGVTVFPTELILIITDPTTSGVISKSTITQYISAASKIVRKISIVDTNSAITCLVNNDPDDMPAKIKIGSKGKTPAYTCDNSTTETGTWEVKDGKNGKINYIEKNTEGTTTATTTLDGDGKIVAYASNSVLDNGGTVDLKSD
ncbi:MAG: hypothetical protein JJV97_04890 [SAR324 cluster bacterium]|nr:hypothetical protein [SAR324 cluster bacterium]